MMKRFLVLLMALTLLSTAVAAAETPVTKIVLWHSMTENAGQMMDQYVQTFNETIGRELNVEVEAVFQGSYSEAVTKMNSILSTGSLEELPDVMQLDATGKTSYMNCEAAFTVDQAVTTFEGAADVCDSMLPPALSNWNLAGTQLGLPFATSTTIMYYNRTALDAIGASAPETLQDISALAEKLNGDSRVIYACLPNTPTLANWLGQLGSHLVNHANGNDGNATELDCIDNGALLTFLTAWKDLYASGALSNTAGSTDAFVAGQQLIMTGSSSNITSILSKVGDAFEVGFSTYPRVNPDAAHGASVNGSCLVMFRHDDEQRLNAAWQLMTYLTGSDVQASFASHTGYLPSNLNAAHSPEWLSLIESQPEYDIGFRQLMNTPASMRSVTVGPSADFYYSIQNDVSDFLEDGMSPEEGVELLADDLNGLLAQYALANP